MSSKKIPNDKYYTPRSLASYVVAKTNGIIGRSNITEYLEPSGGAGVFLDFLPEGTYSCDIEPEDDRVEQGNFLELDLPYKQGRCVIGNPPYGERGNLFTQFYNKACELGDYIAFILPISQLNNDVKLYKFDLIYSEDLGRMDYSGIEVHCCLNIYRRPSWGGYNKRKDYKLEDVEIYEIRRGGRNKLPQELKYDIGICRMGASIGKEPLYEGQYVGEFYFIIHNEELKDEIIQAIKNADWCKEYPMTATPNLLHWQVYKYLRKVVKGIK